MKNISNYYSSKIERHGPTPRGVDWNSEESQEIRFKQISKVLERNQKVLDYGCGYASLLRYLTKNGLSVEYTGFDISAKMVEEGRKFLELNKLDGILTSERPNGRFDSVVASGIFSVKLDIDEKEWMNHIASELAVMNKLSRSGFSFNMLTKYSDADLMRDDLFYADPCYWFDYCKRNFSRNVALLHDYELYEYTLLVRKG